MQFASNEEFFSAIRELASELERAGHHSASVEVTDGLACLNGLTDGWALLLESLERARRETKASLGEHLSQTLDGVIAATRKTVYRR